MQIGRAAALAAFLAAAAAVAAPPAREEIDALLERLARSECCFNRNGEWHDARKAREHLEDKLAHLERRAALESAEQFIDQVATGSSITGTPYLVQCGKAAPVTSAAWLSVQLKSLRAKR